MKIVSQKMSYRPKDWKKGIKASNKSDYTTDDLNHMYEAGADALYSALWKMAEESPTKTFTLDANVTNCPGFSIPDEAEEYMKATTVEFTADDIIN